MHPSLVVCLLLQVVTAIAKQRVRLPNTKIGIATVLGGIAHLLQEELAVDTFDVWMATPDVERPHVASAELLSKGSENVQVRATVVVLLLANPDAQNTGKWRISCTKRLQLFAKGFTMRKRIPNLLRSKVAL